MCDFKGSRGQSRPREGSLEAVARELLHAHGDLICGSGIRTQHGPTQRGDL